MAVTTTKTNKPINPRGDDKSPLAFNRAKIYSGKALDFDGVNDWVDLAGLNFSGNNQSFCFYLKADAWGNFDYIFDIYTNRFIIGSKPANNFAIYDGNVWQSFGEIYDTTNTNFFVVTIEGTTCKAYLNGVQFGSDLTISLCDFAAASQCALMAQYDGGQLFFNGSMSGFKAFNTTLTAAQVLDLYNNPEKIVPTGVDNTALKLWLPMMEGAGTTAYDGSGNGNHGTISGATYVNGVGAPVAQSAVMDWNKGTNYVVQSNDFTTSWTTPRATLTSGQSGILGSSDAWKIESNDTGYTGGYYNTTSLNVVNCSSIYAKAGNIDYIFIASTQGSTNNAQYFNLSTGTLGSLVGSGITSADIEDVGDGWYRCSVVMSANASFGYMLFGIANTDANNGSVSGEYIYVQNAQLNNGTSVGPYIPTLSTAQTSDVLLPAGLTSGRDITGVNLFENVRKKYALNLDGQSWAEVHDNESLDVTTGLSLEGWVYVDVSKDIRGALIAKYKFTQSARAYSLELDDLTLKFILSSNGSSTTSVQGSTTISTTGWYHFVSTYDDSNIKVYLNGAEDNTQAYSGGIYAQDYPVTIGVLDTASQATSIMKDQIAQPRIYNRALTDDEVEQNYNAGKNTYS